MGKLILSTFLFISLITASVYAQRCGTVNYYQKHPITNAVANYLSSQGRTARDTSANEVITIPVVIHILYNTAAQNISDAQILSQLKSLNNDYRKLNADAANVPGAFASLVGDARITFCLARVDNAGKATSGIVRKYTSVQSWTADDGMKFTAQGGDNAWDAKRYLNIWVCNLFGRSLGYSSLPGSSADKDGVVIQYDAFGTTGAVNAPFNKGRTATHEIGHWLGLKHLWGDANCGDDGIADTPPQQSFNNGCPSFPHKSSCSINSNGDLFMNFMDFTDDGCMYMFTHGQVTKMRSQFASGAPRNSFLNSNVCDSNAVQSGALPIVVDTTTNNNTNNKLISVYPNPAVKFINVDSKNASDFNGKMLKIYNIYGAEIMSKFLTTQKNSICVEKLAKGVYFIIIGSTDEKQVFKFEKD